jgi:hypothetical protein
VGYTALKAVSSRMAKHEKTFFDNQHIFILFAFDSFGFLARKAENLLKNVQKVIYIYQ